MGHWSLKILLLFIKRLISFFFILVSILYEDKIPFPWIMIQGQKGIIFHHLLSWSGAYQISLFNACSFLLEILPNLGKYKLLLKFEIPPFTLWLMALWCLLRSTKWWSAQLSEECWVDPQSPPHATLCWCKFSLWTARSRWGKPCHQVENRPVVLSQRQYSLPVGPPEETVRRDIDM